MSPVTEFPNDNVSDNEGAIEIDSGYPNNADLNIATTSIEDPTLSNVAINEQAQPLIPIQEQREVIRKLIEGLEGKIVEGTPLFVIYESWWNAFQSEIDDPANGLVAKLGPIDTTGIVNNDGIFCDYNAYPLKALPAEVFSKLEEWYGLTDGSSTVVTYAIQIDNQLVPEFAKPHFQLHHLTSDSSSTSHNYSYRSHNHSNIPIFAISRLHSVNDLLQHCIKLLDDKQHISKTSPNFLEERFRIWIINDKGLSIIPYSITPSSFIKLESKALVRKDYFGYTLKDAGLTQAHIAIEQYVKATRTSKGYWPSNYYIHHPPTPSDGRIGLQNLGNTCYMNSALQCLVHIPELTQYFLFNSYENELNKDNPLGMGGKVALAFSNLIHNLFDKKSSRGTSYTPRDFKSTIGHFNQMFSGYQQQDSQEFLAFLLDGLHEDLNRIINKPFVEKPELNENDAQNPDAIRELAQKSWDHHKLRNDSIIIDLFVGQYKSTLICPSCDKISITFDPFNDLTLPLPVANQWTGKLVLFLEEGPIRSFEVELPKTSTYQTLKKYVATKLNLDPNNLFTAEVWNNQFYRNFESSESQSGYLPISDLISDSDVVVMYEVKHEKDDLIVPVLNTVLPDSGIPSAFGIPFFITLSPVDRNSFGVIRQKLEHRYEQLSTFHYFSNTREAQGKSKFGFSDFNTDDSISISDSESIISLANPEISGEYAFKIKLFDSSKEIESRKRFTSSRYGGYGGYGGVKKSTGETDGIWTPNSKNNFTKLPDLLDKIDEKKAAFYRYANEANAKEIEEQNENNAVDAINVDSLEATGTGDSDIQNASSKEDYEIIDLTNNLDEDEDTSEPDANAANALESLNSYNLDKIDEPTSVDQSSTTLFDTVSSDKGSDTSPENSPIEKELIGYKTALVCEWSPDEFDVFFSGLEEEGKGGTNTWANPEVLVNEEVEELRQKREAQKNTNLSLDQCLRLFSNAEVLGEHDLWYCSNCKEHRQATKQIQIWSTPDILSIHLKRFENQRSFSDKITDVVEFPIEGLDMSPYIAHTVEDENKYIYDLFAVDNHYGGLGGGHYTSYVKNFIDNTWYYYDDSRVTPTTPEKSISGAAYLLFYRRRSSDFLGGEELVKMLEAAREQHDQQEREDLAKLEEFYRLNKEDSSESDEDDENDDEVLHDAAEDEESDLNSDTEEFQECSQKDPNTKLDDENSDESDNDVSSIPVGTDDEDDASAFRRKQRVLTRRSVRPGRGKIEKRRILQVSSIVPSDIESPAAGSPASSHSDDDCSTYSSSVVTPVFPKNHSTVNSPR